MIGVTAWKEPTAAVQITTASFYNWLNLPNILAGVPGSTTGAYISGADQYSYKTAQLIKAGVQAGTDKGTPLVGAPYGEVKTFGGAADLWGNTLTRADIMAIGFGVAFEFARSTDGVSKSYRIQATNFGFSVPSDAVITGIEFKLTWSVFSGGGGTTGNSVDKVEVRVHYTFNPKVAAVGSAIATAYVRGREPVEQDKKFRFMIYDSGRNYIGDITKYVASKIAFKAAINTLHSNMALVLAQNEQSTATAQDDWVLEADEPIIIETGEGILFDLAAAIGLGPGSTVEVNNEVDLQAYYGAMHEWVDEADEPIVTDDGELIMFEDGAPLGRSVFTGYLSQWELIFGDGENVTTNLLSHSKELDNIVVETEDVVAMTHGVAGTASVGISGGGPDDAMVLAQVFRYTAATGARGRIRFYGWPGWASDIPIGIDIYNGADPNALGALVTSTTGFIEADPDTFRANTFIDLYFDPSTFTNNADYTIVINNLGDGKTGGNPTYPANFYTTQADVANGQLYYATKTLPFTSYGAGVDLWFEIYTLGGSTTRTFLSQDPGYIMRQLVDHARLKGARVSWDVDTIELTGTIVTLELKTNTISAAIAAVLKTAPADWFYYYDYGTNQLHFHPKPTKPAHYYTKGRDVVKLKVKRTIELIKNDGIFSGGNSLFIRKNDQGKINEWRRGLFKDSDDRVKVQSTAELLLQSVIDQWGEPLYSGDLIVVRVKDFRVEDVDVGELSGFISFGSLVDALKLQNVSMTYHPDHLDITLDINTPPVQKRIEDIKRNLALLEHENDPTTPTIT